MVSIHRKVYVFGGFTNSDDGSLNSLNDVWIFDIGLDKFFEHNC